jgi:3-hydroxymyristoyl/3-hydroxydecanoyl-(acyl carrier protein) dehydratase
MNLPPILSAHVSGDDATFELSLPEQSDAFRGHFPGRPILPGVAQIDWVTQLAARYWALAPIASDFQVKFRSIIGPGMKLTLALRLDRPKRRLHFEYRCEGTIMSSGRIALEPSA